MIYVPKPPTQLWNRTNPQLLTLCHPLPLSLTSSLDDRLSSLVLVPNTIIGSSSVVTRLFLWLPIPYLMALVLSRPAHPN